MLALTAALLTQAPSGHAAASELPLASWVTLVKGGSPPTDPEAARGAARDPVPAGEIAAFHRVAIDSDAGVPEPATTAGRHRFVILHRWQRDRLEALQAEDPDVRVLLYSNLTFISDSVHEPTGLSSSGVSYAEADAEHPEWFLLDEGGERFAASGYPSNWAARVADPSYQDAWADGVLEEVEAHGWDGVFIDDANPTLRHHHDPEDVEDGYDSDAEYGAAVESALAEIGPRIRSADALAVANICCEATNPGTWRAWLPHLSGAMDETFVKFGDGDPSLETYVWDWGEGGWRTHLGLVEEAERQGRYFLANSHSTTDDARAMRYGLATLLLASEGRASFMHGADYGEETWFPEYELAQRLGEPTGSYEELPGGVFRRDFERGVALVNPTDPEASPPQEVELGGTYSGSGLTDVGAVTLEGKTGLVLQRTP